MLRRAGYQFPRLRSPVKSHLSHVPRWLQSGLFALSARGSMRKGKYSCGLWPLSAEAVPAMPFAQVLHHFVGLLASLILFPTGAALADEPGEPRN